jgi:hypothetical protein
MIARNNHREFGRLLRALRPTLLEWGFDGSERVLNRTSPDGLTQVVGFQIGVRSMSGKCTVNIGISVPEVLRATGGESGPVPEEHCAIRARLGSLGPERADRWWTIDASSRVVADIAARLRDDALPFFARFATRDAILREYTSEFTEEMHAHGVPPRLIAAIILAARGERDAARRLLDEQIAETRAPGHADYVRALGAQLGLI